MSIVAIANSQIEKLISLGFKVERADESKNTWFVYAKDNHRIAMFFYSEAGFLESSNTWGTHVMLGNYHTFRDPDCGVTVDKLIEFVNRYHVRVS